MAEGQEKTEAPTPRRRQEARDDGKVAKSTDLTSAGLLLAAVVLLYVFGLRMLMGMQTVLRYSLSGPLDNQTRSFDVETLGWLTSHTVLTAAAPFIVLLSCAVIVVTMGQVGIVVSTKALMPDFSRLSPLQGAKNLFSLRAGMRLVMSLLKVAIIGGVAGWLIYVEMPAVVNIAQLDVAPMVGYVSGIVFRVALKLATLLFVLAILDFAYQKWQQEQDMKMSKQDIKDELKRMDGDPLVKQRRARVARQLAMQRTAQAVPQADVIVANPTHFSIAIKYDSAKMNAPKVVAKGADLLALRMRQIATQHDIPIVERKDVARALYANVEVGQEVPPEFYSAVAEILAYVYRLSGRQSA